MLCEASVKLFAVFGSAWKRYILSFLFHTTAMKTVRILPFSQIAVEKKFEVKRLGPDRGGPRK